MKRTYSKLYECEFGRFLLTSDGEALNGLLVLKDKVTTLRRSLEIPEGVSSLFAATERQLQRYFDGHIEKFSLPLRLEGTPFQWTVWNALTEIPFGTTVSYSELARRIGQPKACRAIGNANGKNPICIIVPCHRVISNDGEIGGYSGGLPLKRKLLKLESQPQRRPVTRILPKDTGYTAHP